MSDQSSRIVNKLWSYCQVLRDDGLSYQDEVPTAGALCQRRQQLGVTPLRELFARLAHPIALPQTRSAFRFGLRVLATDGTLENLPDSDANRTVFPYHTQEEFSRSPFPQARCVLLMECGTHVIFDAEITTPSVAAIERNPVTANSLPTIITTAQAGAR